MRLFRFPRPLPLIAALVVGLVAAPAWAQTDIQSREGIALRDQIAELRHQVQVLQEQIANGGGSSLGAAARPAPSGGNSDLTAQLLVRVQQLEDQVRQLRGRADELQNNLQQQSADLSKQIDDLKFEMENPAAAAAARKAAAAAAQAGTPPAGAPPAGLPQGTLGTMPAGMMPPGPGMPPPAQAPRTPEVAMQQGNAALARRDYPAAEAAAREVLANRASPRAYDAEFLLAEAQFGQRQYSQAALSYDDTYNRSRKGPRAEDALLGLANSLTGIGDKTSACQALAKLHAEFPNLRPDLRDAVAATRQRAACR
ncbi:MAG TPA: tetratricopeptide repeat protein [Acetobacteraceae bacterium]|jgi:TolA-binding protein|nr:tetratricopeptide repeat protein [Acetobacteraceae bacterium]